MATAAVAQNDVFSESTSESVASEAEDSGMEGPATPRAALPLKAWRSAKGFDLLPRATWRW